MPPARLPAAAAPLGARRPPRRRRGSPRTTPRTTARAGLALAEVLVAGLVLVVGVLATAGSVAGAVRDARRARALDAAGDAVAARVARWRAAPCAPESGEAPAGVGRERWSVRVAGGLGVLADTVTADAGPLAPRVGVVAVAWCGP